MGRFLLWLLLLIGCKESITNKEKNISDKDLKNCSNIVFYGRFFLNEQITLKLNNKIVLRDTIKNNSQRYYNNEMCLAFTDTFLLNVQTFYNNQKIIDTILIGYSKEQPYEVTVSLPHPYNWEEYYKDGIPVKPWGKLPIDSCIRFISIKPLKDVINAINRAKNKSSILE